MLTTVAWQATQASGYTALIPIAGCADQHIAVSVNDIYVPSLNQLAGFYACGVSLGSARLTSPSLRANFPVDIDPIDAAALPTSWPPFHNIADQPIQLKTNEALNAQEMSSVTSNEKYVGAWLCDGPITPVSSRATPVKCTSATTLVAHTWTAVPLTFPSTLPAGRYQIVGMRAHSATAVLSRLIIPGYPWRPGCIGFSTVLKTDHPAFRYGNLGVWGEFDSRQPPQAEFLATAADTAETVMLDLVRL